jgi:type II secretory pathway pseudopilin PulG
MESNGDTIIEVLVVLAVLGLAIGISFATANRSLLATRAAQENSQATAALQSEVEELRYLAPANSGQPIFSQTQYFCIDTTNNTIVLLHNGTLTNLNSSTYPNGCVKQSLYYVAIAPATSDGTFILTAHWNDVQGQGEDTATLDYRVHQ